jgi:hypothetical protein
MKCRLFFFRRALRGDRKKGTYNKDGREFFTQLDWCGEKEEVRREKMGQSLRSAFSRAVQPPHATPAM